ncbi:MAG: urease accessory protein [Rhodoferax sp.]|jgi:urease accessory protein
MPSTLLKALLLTAAFIASTGASAHVGAEARAHIDFIAGLLHPLGGMDHLAAMLAVGFWGALSTRRLWTLPLAFVGLLLVGALMGMTGLALPAVEPMIAASLLVLGLLVALRAQLPTLLGVTLVGVFAVFHGVAHGAELGGAGQVMAPLAGMLIATVALHLTGLGLGLALRSRNVWWPRLAGGIVALLGGGLLVQMI